MSDRDALLAAVLAAPDDNLPRLVFADWLEESGHPALAARAHYIRAQVELPKHPPGSDAWLEINRASADLRDRFHDEWDEEFRDPSDWRGLAVTRRRGFVDEVKADLDRFGKLAPRIFASAPVRTLRLTASGYEVWGKFLSLTCLGGVSTIQFGPAMHELNWPLETPEIDLLSWILMHKHLTGLQRLELSGNWLHDSFVIRFVKQFPTSPLAATVTELDLSSNFITTAGAHTLHAASGLDGLNQIVLTGNRLTAPGIDLLRRRFGDRVVV